MSHRFAVAVLLSIAVFACGGKNGSTAPIDGGDADANGNGGVAGGQSSGGSGGAAGSSDGGTGGVVPAGGSGGSVFVPPPTCVVAASLPSWRTGMAIGEWKQLPSADITKVVPDVMPSGGYYGRIDAWNGFAADTVNSVLYLAGAGGHADYAGNEVYALDLRVPAPQWVIRQQPSPASAYTVDKAYYTDGRPSPTHTYYTAWFIEQRAKFFRFAGAATWGSGNGSTTHIDSWNPTANTWDPAATNPDIAGGPTYEMPTAKNQVTGDVYQVQSNNHLYRWNRQDNTVTDLGGAAMGSRSFYDFYKAPSVVDTLNDRVIFFSNGANPGSARIYNIGAKAWGLQKVGGAEAAAVAKKESQAMAFFDSCAKKIVFKSTDKGAVYLVDPTTLEAVALPTTGSAPPSPQNGVHTLFQYVPKLGGYAYQPTHPSKMYFLATQ